MKHCLHYLVDLIDRKFHCSFDKMEVNSDSFEFWTTLEADFETKFPDYFKNILT